MLGKLLDSREKVRDIGNNMILVTMYCISVHSIFTSASSILQGTQKANINELFVQ